MKIKDCSLREVLECGVDENIAKIAKKLRDKKQRHIVVTDNKKPVGIISTTDMNNRVVAEKKDLNKTTGKEIMTSKVLVKDINEPLSQAYIEMIKCNIFSCPVTQNGKLKGTLDLKEAMEKLAKAEIK